jgi:hypothetical protein
MSPVRNLAVVLVTATATSGAPPAAGVYTADPPADLNALLATLQKRERPADVAKAVGDLSSRDAAAPYLRMELAAATGAGHRRDLAAALGAIEARAYERSKARYAGWAEAGRLDLCAELLVACREEKDAPGLADLTVPFRRRVLAEYDRAVGPVPLNGRKYWGPEFHRAHDSEHLSGQNLALTGRDGRTGCALARADRCTSQVVDLDKWVVAVRSELRSDLPPHMRGRGLAGWSDSVVLVNNSFQVPRLANALVVCDGDAVLATSVDQCVVVANGDIRSERAGAGVNAYLCATGDIVLPAQKAVGNNRFHAGGSVTLGKDAKPSDRVREGQKELPFGIRFLDPREFGLVLAAQNGGLQVMEDIPPTSPFARYGVEKFDVIVTIDEEPASSIPAFRRQLRRGVVAESVFLRIRRGKEHITRVVYLDGVPLPPAPPPREKR